MAFPPDVTEAGDAVNAFIVGGGQGLAVTVVVVDDCPPQPAVAINWYVVVLCGWAISTKPLVVNQVPIPGILMVTPVPEGSLTDQDNRTVEFPPIVTALGDAENELMVGGGQGLTVTVVWAELGGPQLPLLEILTLFRVLPGVYNEVSASNG